MTGEPRLVRRGVGWVLICPTDTMMVLKDGDTLNHMSEHVFIVLRKVTR